MGLVNTFEKHRSEPDKTLQTYTKDVRLRLGREIGKRKKIYLDTKYWLLLRDAVLERAKNKHLFELLFSCAKAFKLKTNLSYKEDIFVEI
jgi:hypothetical protein